MRLKVVFLISILLFSCTYEQFKKGEDLRRKKLIEDLYGNVKHGTYTYQTRDKTTDIILGKIEEEFITGTLYWKRIYDYDNSNDIYDLTEAWRYHRDYEKVIFIVIYYDIVDWVNGVFKTKISYLKD